MSYSPPGESAADLWVERSNLDGVVLAGVTYGVLFTIAVQCIQLLYQSRIHDGKTARPLLVYTVLMLALATTGFGCNAKFNEMTYIDFRNFPGGPNAFTVTFYSIPVNMAGFACYVIMSWIADGLVLYRFILIWNYNYWMLPIPALIYLGSIAMSVSLMVAMSRPEASFWSLAAVNFGIAYWSLSIALNVLLTLLIAGRLLMFRRKITSVLGAEHSKTYTSVMSMIVESASLYSIWGLVFIISYARGSPFQNIVLPPLGQVQGIAPLLIILRVAQGRAWSRETVAATTSGKVFTSRRPSTFATGVTSATVTTNSIPLDNLHTGKPIGMHSDAGSDWEYRKGAAV
ncbi:hypothetical protein BDQ12DRAFT_688752 [Crucibulum laeve]|uniref:Uncharacterized protein n=1 Tax=Crucibulum laeve TaxID=68775 RepID=A0A5C3LQB1_9AGAR|nr:hypothetical protein BDQ12DRAFT_688752 [Crucibulum laeve]